MSGLSFPRGAAGRSRSMRKKPNRMRLGFLLAWDGIRKNRRMAHPYLLTCVCMVAMHYILGFLSSPTVLALLPLGLTTVETVLNLGKYVVLLFSLVFLFYTHSFLIRSRQREFGLYNVLGMDKQNLARIITWESLITFALALAGGC